MRHIDPRGFATLLTLTGLLLLIGAFSLSVAAASWFSCGSWPESLNPFAATWYVFTGKGMEPGCADSLTLARVLSAISAVVIFTAGTIGVLRWTSYTQSDAYFIRELRQRPGFASPSEISKHLSAKAVLKRAPQLRPGTPNPQPTDVGWKIGMSRGQSVYVSIEDALVLEGAPRSGKGYRVLINAIIDWAGPLITTSTTNDNLAATLKMREQRGDVHVFDPQGLTGTRNPIRINPILGCEDPEIAMQRGSAIITGTALGASSNNQEWAQASSFVLARLLHAAAVGGRDVADLYDWGASPMLAQAAVNILRADGTEGWGDGLAAVLNGDDKLLSSTWFGVQGAVAPLASPRIREALKPRAGDTVFSPEEFLAGENTLYLIGSASGAAAMGGFLSAILDDIVEVARRKALSSPGARLQVPLGLILDEIANMFRWGSLPRIMADGGGRGICTMVVLQALSQAETAWSQAEAATIWSAATAKVLLGGAGDAAHLRDIEALMGTREMRRTQRSWSTTQGGVNTSEQFDRRALIDLAELRRMPETIGLLAYRTRRPVLLELPGWTDRRDASRISAGKRTVESDQQQVFQERFNASLPPRPPLPTDLPE